MHGLEYFMIDFIALINKNLCAFLKSQFCHLWKIIILHLKLSFNFPFISKWLLESLKSKQNSLF